MVPERRIALWVGLFLFIVLSATAGYYIILDVSFVDALYMTVITISTVGYREVVTMSEGAKIYSIIVIVVSVGTGGFIASRIIAFFSGGYIAEVWRKRKMDKSIDALNNHYIICGAGETGAYIIRQFKQQGIPFVVIDDTESVIEGLRENNINCVLGDATQEEVLKKAKIEDAQGLIASLSKDADNVFVVLTAKQMKEDIQVVARAFDKRSHKKLKRAGANHTVSPNEIGGRKMANMLLKPSVTFFMDHVIETDNMALDLEEIYISPKSEFADKKLVDCKIPEKTGLIILAIFNKEKEKFEFNPSQNSVLHGNDRIIVVGEYDKIENLKELTKDKS